MRINSPHVREGARRIISRSLGLRRGEDVVILIDESTLRVGRALAEAAQHYAVRPTLIWVPRADQPRYANNDALPLPTARAIDAAQAIIIAVSDDPAGTGFRVNALRQSRQFKSKVALMPGVTLEMVGHMAQVDYETLAGRCEALRLPLLLGREVVVSTVDAAGNEHTLRLEIGGWEAPPTLASGIVRPRSWDNIPSGEIYVPPLKGSANGDVMINGSVKGYVFEVGDEIRVTFRDGALTQITPQEHPAARFLYQAIERARNAGDREPHVLCELGIGVDPAMAELTGNTLRDEKACGTAHVAIGANEPFGGNVEADHIHETLVFRKPTITVDARVILQQGNVRVRDKDWRHNFRHVTLRPPYDSDTLLVTTTGVEGDFAAGGLLKRVYFDGTDTKSTVCVGSNETSRLAAELYAQLPEDGPIAASRLAELTDHPLDTVRRVLFVMGHFFGLVRGSIW